MAEALQEMGVVLPLVSVVDEDSRRLGFALGQPLGSAATVEGRLDETKVSDRESLVLAVLSVVAIVLAFPAVGSAGCTAQSGPAID